MAGPTHRQHLDQIQKLLEEIVEDNTAVIAGTNRIRVAQETMASDLAREVSQLRGDLGGALVYRALKDLCTELVGPLTAIEAMLERADFSDPEAIACHVRGLWVTLQNVLARMGAERIAVAVGTELFDPSHHRCNGVCDPATSPFPDAPPRTIVRVVEHGYTLGGRLISPPVVEIQSGRDREAKADQATQ